MKLRYRPVVAILAGSALLANQPDALVRVGLLLAPAFVVVDAIPAFRIRPFGSGDRTHVGLLTFAYILGPIAFGVYGVFLGPIILVLVTEFAREVGPDVLSGHHPARRRTLTDA